MSAPILATKLFIPQSRPDGVTRPRLLARLNAGLHRKMTLVSASAGFGKTTLVAEWVRSCSRPVSWLSLDSEESDLGRFMTYLVAALQKIEPGIGAAALSAFESPQPLPLEAILTTLVNDIAAIPDNFILVLDDYHLLDAPAIDNALTFLIDYLPPQMHLVMVTREDPSLPLPRLRASGQLNEFRAADLRFEIAEAGQFLNSSLGLTLSDEAVLALETRTEGWIAGLQLAGISLQGHHDSGEFIESFTGSHHFVLDYLITEVLQQQPEPVQRFLLHTSLLDRFCAPLCDAVIGAGEGSSQETLAYLAGANLFIVPLDNERRWYRYHHLFADLLRQRFLSRVGAGGARKIADEIHGRASIWFEQHDFEFEAFHHAAAANDIPRATRLTEGRGMPLHFRGGVAPVHKWLASLPEETLDEYPILWTSYASVLLVQGLAEPTERALNAAEAALPHPIPEDPAVRDVFGRAAAIRSTLAASRYQVEEIIALSKQALTYLDSDNLAFRTSTNWKLGFAFQLQGERSAAIDAYEQVIASGTASGNLIFVTMAQIGLGGLLRVNNQLHKAAELIENVLQSFDGRPLSFAVEAYNLLTAISYEWNELERASELIQRGSQLAKQFDLKHRVASFAVAEAQRQLALDNIKAAVTAIRDIRPYVERHKIESRVPEINEIEMMILLRQGKLQEAKLLAERVGSKVGLTRFHLAQNEPQAAVQAINPFLKEAEARGWPDQKVRAHILLALAYQASGDLDAALVQLEASLTATERGDLIRLYVDEGEPLAKLLAIANARSMHSDYANRILTAFGDLDLASALQQPLLDPLSPRELEVLQLVAQGLSNREISERLFLALSTVKGHNRLIYDKLNVGRRTEAVARARELGII